MYAPLRLNGLVVPRTWTDGPSRAGLTRWLAGYSTVMSTPSSRPSTPAPGRTPGAAGVADTGAVAGVDGSTEVLPAVVAKVTAFAAREIPGVVTLGGNTARAVGAVRQTLTGNSENTAGVRVELADQKASIGMDIGIEYGVGAKELVKALRRHVPLAVEQIAGIPVVELNIVITDVHLPGADTEAGA